MKVGEMKRIVLHCLEEHGLTRVASVARFDTDELRWIIEPDPSPRGHRLGIDVGCLVKSLASGAAPERANDCHVYVALENLAFDIAPSESSPRFSEYRSFTALVLDERAQLPDDERAGDLRRVLEPLANLVSTTRTTEMLRSHYTNGLFDSAFIDREVRALLDGDC